MQVSQPFKIVAERFLEYGTDEVLYFSLIFSEEKIWIEVSDRERCIGRHQVKTRRHGDQLLSLLVQIISSFKDYHKARTIAIIALRLRWTRELIFYLFVVNRKFTKEDVNELVGRYALLAKETTIEEVVPFMSKCKIVVTVKGRDIPIGQFLGNDFTGTEFRFQFNGKYFNR